MDNNILDNPNFIKWFGESVVRNEDGSPKPVYHLSKTGGFQKFMIAPGDIGIHFGSIDSSNDRGEFLRKQRKSQYQKLYKDRSPQIYDANELEHLSRNETKLSTYVCYLKLENPLEIRDLGGWADAENIASNIIAEHRCSPTLIRDLQEWLEAWRADDEDDEEEYDPEGDINDVRYYIQGAGYDGLMYINEYENKQGKEYSYCVFNPTQIKSALHNNGNYSSESENITEGIETFPLSLLLER